MPFLRIARNKKGHLKGLTHVFVTASGRLRVTAKPVECNDPQILAAAGRDEVVEVVTADQLAAEAEAEAEGSGAVQALKAALESALAKQATATAGGSVEITGAVTVDIDPEDEGPEDEDVPGAEPSEDDEEATDPQDNDDPADEVFEVPDVKAADVLDWVDDDPVRAQAALDVEVAKGDGARKGLVADLTAVVEVGSDG